MSYVCIFGSTTDSLVFPWRAVMLNNKYANRLVQPAIVQMSYRPTRNEIKRLRNHRYTGPVGGRANTTSVSPLFNILAARVRIQIARVGSYILWFKIMNDDKSSTRIPFVSMEVSPKRFYLLPVEMRFIAQGKRTSHLSIRIFFFLI